jgi:outer membrane protein OmpA-like peptidoglycan-associated protein
MRNRFLLGAGVAAIAVALGWADARAQLFAMPGGPGAFYVGGEGGWSWLGREKGKVAGFGLSQKFDCGPVVGLTAGYEWGPVRIAEEFAYRNHDMKTVTLGGFPTVGVNGDRTTYAFMTNLIYDVNLGWPISPHIGGGVGAVLLRDGFSIPGFGTVASSHSWELGYQGIAGVRYNINPALAFDIDYRYFATTDPTFRAIGGIPYKSSYDTHNVLASFTVKFGAPPPPPPVAAPPAAPAPPPIQRKVFLVFFDWDKYTITPEGMAILQQAAAAYRSGAPVQIQITGYTDRSGSPGYNQRLSERRANAVADALTGLGVPRQQMLVSGRGENDNRVPTADGVREPQNRRVEIVFP